jgi:toxin ParE1/3/4
MRQQGKNPVPMSFPDFTLKLSERAQLDFRDILSYTLQTWGEEQLVKYRDLIASAFTAILKKPEIGRSDIVPYRRYTAGQHCIFYRIEDTTIIIVRILHRRSDFLRHLE